MALVSLFGSAPLFVGLPVLIMRELIFFKEGEFWFFNLHSFIDLINLVVFVVGFRKISHFRSHAAEFVNSNPQHVGLYFLFIGNCVGIELELHINLIVILFLSFWFVHLLDCLFHFVLRVHYLEIFHHLFHHSVVLSAFWLRGLLLFFWLLFFGFLWRGWCWRGLYWGLLPWLFLLFFLWVLLWRRVFSGRFRSPGFPFLVGVVVGLLFLWWFLLSWRGLSLPSFLWFLALFWIFGRQQFSLLHQFFHFLL